MAALASPMDFLTHRLSKAISPPPRTSTSCFWQRKPKKERKDTVKAKNNQKKMYLWPFWKAGAHRAECAFLCGGHRGRGRQHSPSPFFVALGRGVRDRCTILSCSALHWKHQPEEGQSRVFYNAKDISTSFSSLFFGLFCWALLSALINFSVNVKTLA